MHGDRYRREVEYWRAQTATPAKDVLVLAGILAFCTFAFYVTSLREKPKEG